MSSIRKAIIPAAGLGTRFLPQTKAMPKEMLPIIDKPIIQLVVEELVAVGVTDIIIVTGSQKRAIEDHFDRAVELEQELIQNDKSHFAEQIKSIAELANFVYVRQKGLPKGNARPVVNAAHLIGDEPFFVYFPDDFFAGKVSQAQQMADAYERYKCPIVPALEVADSDLSKYGVIDTGEKLDDGAFKVNGVVEKPGKANAPSNLASVGGYILTPQLLPLIEQLTPGVGGEIVLIDALMEYISQGGEVVAQTIEGEYFDGGNKLGYLKAVMSSALKHPDFSGELKAYVKDLI